MVRLIGELDSKQVTIKPTSDTNAALNIKNTSDSETFKITGDGKLQTDFDINQKNLLNIESVRFHGTTAPASPVAGDMYYASADSSLKVYNGSTWDTLATGSGDISSVIAGTGLTGGGESGDVTINVGQGDGISLGADTVAINLSATSGLTLAGTSPNKTLEINNSIAGNGLTIASKVLAVANTDGSLTIGADDVAVTFSGDGSATSASRSDHTHSTYVLKAGDTMTGNLNMTTYKITSSYTPAEANDLVNKTYVDSLVSGISWQEPVNEAATAPTGNEVGNDGWRVLVNGTGTGAFSGHNNTIATWDDSEETWSFETPSDGWAVFNQADDAGYNYTGTAWVQFTGTGTINAGIGLEKDGNTLNVLLGAGIQQLPTDEVGIHLSAVSGLELTGTASSDTLQLADSIAGNGLTISNKVLAVGAGTGISVAADSVAINTGANLTWTGNHNFTTGTFSIDSVELTATATEINQALDGISAGVTFTNLNTLVAGSSSNADALHTHPGLAKQYTSAVTAQTSIPITHNLGKYPVVQALDNSGYWVLPANIQHTSVNAFTVTFAESFTGTLIYMG